MRDTDFADRLFQDLLDQRDIRYTVDPGTGALTVLDSVMMRRDDRFSLPEGLHMCQNLAISGATLGAIKTLRVGRSLSLVFCDVDSLPANLHVQETLNLLSTRLPALPDGLVVGGDLWLDGTSITTLPPDLCVGGEIHPPATLTDLQAFMDTQHDDVFLALQGPHHQRLALLHQLQAFPDVQTVVRSLKPKNHLHLWRNLDWDIQARIEMDDSPS